MKDHLNLGRAWKRKIEFDWFDGIHIALTTYMVKFDEKDIEPIHAYSHFIRFMIKDWKIEAWHQYYDGSNCVWQFGPFAYGRIGYGHCDKCSKDRNGGVDDVE
jgi:hypothetical protein